MQEPEELGPLPLIGRSPEAKPSIAERDEIRGGSEWGLSFRLRWDKPQALEGNLTFYLSGYQIWTTTPHSQPAEMWRSLLHGLGKAWLRLMLEETYPCGASPESPSQTVSELLDSAISPEVAEREFQEFRKGHDISSWFSDDARLPALWFVREGVLVVVEGNGRVLRWAFGDVRRTLTELGEALNARLATSDNQSAVAREAWANREVASNDEVNKISLGVDLNRVRSLVEKGVLSRTPNRSEILRGLDEIRAAARMLSNRVNDSEVVKTAALIRSQSYRSTSELDLWATEALKVLQNCKTEIPHVQGMQLAQWLRRKVRKIQYGSRVEPQDLLADFGVEIVPFETETHIHAISFWGPSHGPAILLNTKSRSSGQGRFIAFARLSGGHRATLAHELCHLLTDRGGSLPVAEVFGGAVPRAPEVRANSFMAEFLLPQDFAGEAYKNNADAKDALKLLTITYGVTRTVAAWQILKRFWQDTVVLREADRRMFERIVSPRRFSFVRGVS
jgi:Zn-dependent peptidase ImmA (M78 family)